MIDRHKLFHSLDQADLLFVSKCRHKLLQQLSVLNAPCKFGIASLNGFLLHMLYDKRGHCLDHHRYLRKCLLNDREYLKHICLLQIHRKPLDHHKYILTGILNLVHIGRIHCRFSNLVNRSVFGQKLLSDLHRFRQIDVVPPQIFPIHAITSRIQTTGDIDNHCVRMTAQILFHQLIQHNRSGNNAIAHCLILIRIGEIIVQFRHDLYCHRILNLGVSLLRFLCPRI